MYVYMYTLTANNDGLAPLGPLEAAYNWSLSCSSALNKELLFLCHEDSFKFECKELLPGRLFPQTDSSEYDKSFPAVKHDTGCLLAMDTQVQQSFTYYMYAHVRREGEDYSCANQQEALGSTCNTT